MYDTYLFTDPAGCCSTKLLLLIKLDGVAHLITHSFQCKSTNYPENWRNFLTNDAMLVGQTTFKHFGAGKIYIV